jgi:hypothetical protein
VDLWSSLDNNPVGITGSGTVVIEQELGIPDDIGYEVFPLKDWCNLVAARELGEDPDSIGTNFSTWTFRAREFRLYRSIINTK